MKHTFSITIVLLGMFLVTQFIGLGVIGIYSPAEAMLPYGTEPPTDISPGASLISIVIALFFAIMIMLIIMRFKAEIILRVWFFIVITLALGITINAFLLNFSNSATIALVIALPLAFLKIFRRNILIHNATELLVYPGIAAIFVPILSLWTAVILLILISIYDMYAVWHAGIMQKMARYQMDKVKIFAGFFVPYLGKKQRAEIEKLKKSKKKLKNKKIKINVAILGGGDVVFPMILAGTVLITLGLIQAILVAIGATIALGILFYMSEKNKFYPAMPFITAGAFVGLALAHLV